MLKKLLINNYLYIQDAQLDFHKGLNIIVGESGVGKSLLVNILSIPLGFQPGVDMVGKWGKSARIDLEFENRQTLCIEIGKKVTFSLNDEPIPAKKVREQFAHLLDVHSQNNYELIRGDQLQILERFMNAQELEVWAAYQSIYSEYATLLGEIEQLKKQIFSEPDRDYFSYQLKELTDLNLKTGEDEECFQKLRNSRQSLEITQRFQDLKDSMDQAHQSTLRAVQQTSSLGLDQTVLDRLSSLSREIEDLLWELAKKEKSMEPLTLQEADAIEERLNELENAKKKHKRSLVELLAYQTELKERFDNQEQFIHDLQRLDSTKRGLQEEVQKQAIQLSTVRETVADRITQYVHRYLAELKLGKTELAPSFVRKSDFDKTGIDEFSFLIRINVGSAFHSLSKISGGETSRIMLALKAALMHASVIETYIFDEIDAGVSGDIALKMGELLKGMSGKRQLIVITHLPMIAVKADRLFQLEKAFLKAETRISVNEIKDREQWIIPLSTLIAQTPSEQSKAYIKSLL